MSFIVEMHSSIPIHALYLINWFCT